MAARTQALAASYFFIVSAVATHSIEFLSELGGLGSLTGIVSGH
jgi:hypothetical protein